MSNNNLPTYRLLTGIDDGSFCEKVSEILTSGYDLYGSPSVTFDGSKVVLVQAVVKTGTIKSSQTIAVTCSCSSGAKRPERFDRPERFERPERSEKFERPERSERFERPERSERSDSFPPRRRNIDPMASNASLLGQRGPSSYNSTGSSSGGGRSFKSPGFSGGSPFRKRK